MIYYNQNDYANIPYPSPSNPNATIKSGGCGVVSICMIVSNLTSTRLTVPEGAKLSMFCGARVSGGTDMQRLSQVACQKYGMTYTTTSDENALIKHIQSGGMAIANVGGDRSGWTGVFSDSGHYVVVATYDATTKKLGIMDPGYYSGKFNKTGRKGKVQIQGNLCYVTPAVLHADTYNRTPNYYLFSAISNKLVQGDDEDMTLEQFTELFKEYRATLQDNDASAYSYEARKWARDNGLLKGDSAGSFNGSYEDFLTREQMCVFLHRFYQMLQNEK